MAPGLELIAYSPEDTPMGMAVSCAGTSTHPVNATRVLAFSERGAGRAILLAPLLDVTLTVRFLEDASMSASGKA